MTALFLGLFAGGYLGFGSHLGVAETLAAAILSIGASASFGLTYLILAGHIDATVRRPPGSRR